MNAKERFHETYYDGSPDRVFLWPQWAFKETLQRWRREGLPWDHLKASYRDRDFPCSTSLRNGLDRALSSGYAWTVVDTADSMAASSARKTCGLSPIH